MKRTIRDSLLIFPVMLVVFAVICSGCSKGPSDSQLAANVQSKISADPGLQGQSISVTAKDGAVTLSGSVNEQGTRELAASDAAQVKGVRTVVNNLSIGGVPATPAATGGNNAARRSAPPPPARQTAPSSPTPAAQPTAIPSGTRVRVRLGETLSTQNSHAGDSFSATLSSPIVVDGQTVVPAGAGVRGTVIEDKSPGRFKGEGVLAIRLQSLQANGASYPIQTNVYAQEIKGKGKRSAVMTGGGAGLGAIIGGIAGGGKGALIGGLVGGSGGAAGSALTGNKEIVLPAETILTFTLQNSVTLNP